MTHVYLANARPEERSALRLRLLDMKMEVVGEAADWPTTLAQVPILCPDILLVDWDLLSTVPSVELEEIRKVCQGILVILLINNLSAHQQAAPSAGDDTFISQVGLSRRVVERLQAVAANITNKSRVVELNTPSFLPQMAENNTPRPQDAAGEYFL